MMKILTYSELITLGTFEERLEYLKLDGTIGENTFGFDRYLNQMFYTSQQWRQLRPHIIDRDLGRDLAFGGHDIYGQILIHHMNPLRVKDIVDQNDYLLNPEFLICTSKKTHNYIHYGIRDNTPNVVYERKPNDTCPWRRNE